MVVVSAAVVCTRSPAHACALNACSARWASKRLLEASLRLRPDRILLAELRGVEACDYLRSVNSGHTGSIASIDASSPELALR